MLKSLELGTNLKSRRIRLSSFLSRIANTQWTDIVVVDVAVDVDKFERNFSEFDSKVGEGWFVQ